MDSIRGEKRKDGWNPNAKKRERAVRRQAAFSLGGGNLRHSYFRWGKKKCIFISFKRGKGKENVLNYLLTEVHGGPVGLNRYNFLEKKNRNHLY